MIEKMSRRITYKSWIKILSLIILLSTIPMFQGCQTMKIKKAQKNAMKVEQTQKKESEKLHEKLVKRQKNIPTDEAKDRIKESNKRAKKYNEKRRKERKFFLWRWLGV